MRAERQTGKTGEYEFSCLLVALNDVRRLEFDGKKAKYMKAVSDERIEKLRIDRSKRRKPISDPKARQVVKQFIPLIEKMRDENLSWRRIAMYLGKYHKLSISYEYLRRIYNDNS